jgi:hypothetical protein
MLLIIQLKLLGIAKNEEFTIFTIGDCPDRKEFNWIDAIVDFEGQVVVFDTGRISFDNFRCAAKNT